TAVARGLASALAGRVAEALPVLAEGGPRAPQAKLDTATPKTTLGSGYLQAGRLAEAAGVAARAAELAVARGYRGSQARASHLLGGISARRDPHAVAPGEGHYRPAPTPAAGPGRPPPAAPRPPGLPDLPPAPRPAP